MTAWHVFAGGAWHTVEHEGNGGFGPVYYIPADGSEWQDIEYRHRADNCGTPYTSHTAQVDAQRHRPAVGHGDPDARESRARLLAQRRKAELLLIAAALGLGHRPRLDRAALIEAILDRQENL